MGSYYDLDDIFVEDELMATVFQKGVNKVEIDPGSENNSVEPGSKVELPFWLAFELQQRQVVSINVPSCFNQKTRYELQADAACVDLRSRCLYFYEFGCKIAPLVNDRNIGYMLFYAFKIRFREVLTKAHSAAFVTLPKFFARLTKEEINIYEAAQSSMAAFKKWRMGGPRYHRASVLGRKRKPS